MILTLIDVVLPVFLVVAAGYASAKAGLISANAIDALNHFAQNFAIPCLLFLAVMRLDLGAYADPGLLISYYTGAITVFILAILGARAIFGRRPGEAVAIGFVALYANTVLLGLPITERAFGAEALGPNYAIIALHAPICYGMAITLMEILRADGRGVMETTALTAKAILKNALMIGIFLGFAANVSSLRLPPPLLEAIELLASAALPAAIFGLGGVLSRYKIAAQLGPVAMLAALSLVLQPAITWALSTMVFTLTDGMIRSAVLTAAMAPGINTYIFATMYNRATDVASSAVILCTLLSLISVPLWLSILP